MRHRFLKALHAYYNGIPTVRRMLRFRRRTLLLAVAVVVFGLIIGRELHRGMRQKQALADVRHRGGIVNLHSSNMGIFQQNWAPGINGIMVGIRRLSHRLLRSENSEDVRLVSWNLRSQEDLDLLHMFPELRELTLSGAKVTDAAVERLIGLRKLNTLSLIDAAITEKGVSSIAQLPCLYHLSFQNCAITEQGLKAITQLSGLHLLSFQNCSGVTVDLIQAIRETNPALSIRVVPGVHIPSLQEMPNQKSLTLSGEFATDATLAAMLGDAPGLTMLELDQCDFSDEGLEHISQLSNLTHLTVMNCQVTDQGLQSIGRLAKLDFLRLNGEQITDAGLGYLSPLKDLTWLYLDDTAITDEGIRELYSLKKLRLVSLNDTKVSDRGLAEIAGHSSLEYLSLRGTRITDNGIRPLAGMKSLRSLDLDNSQVTDQSIEDLCRLSLFELHVSGTKMTRQGVERLRERFGESAVPAFREVQRVSEGLE